MQGYAFIGTEMLHNSIFKLHHSHFYTFLNHPITFLGDRIQCYTGFISTDRQELSNSNYAGAVTIFDWSVESCKLDPIKKPPHLRSGLLSF